MKHTPGPWKIDNGDEYNPEYPWFGIWKEHKDPNFSKCIACVEYTEDSMVTKQEAQANANLIAAAPELLEAALSVLYDLACYCNTHEPGPGPNRRLAALQEAIAKASTY